MVGRTLHYISLACCLFVVASFGLFAFGQVSHASARQAASIALPGPRTVPVSSHPPGQPKRFIDDVAGKLTSPFQSIVASDDAWVTHGIPALFALLLYGGGLGFLARWASGRAGDPSGRAGSDSDPHVYV